jgi:drug/metabolite transporter (DMT)-like permease
LSVETIPLRSIHCSAASDLVGVSVAATLFGLNSVTLSLCQDANLNVISILASRILIFFFLVLVFALMMGSTRGPVLSRPVTLKGNIIGLLVVPLLYILALGRLSVAQTTILMFVAPIYVSLWEHWRRRQLPSFPILSLLSTLICGMTLLLDPLDAEKSADPIGTLLAVASGVALAAYYVLISESPEKGGDQIGSGALPQLARGLVIPALLAAAGLTVNLLRDAHQVSLFIPNLFLLLTAGVLGTFLPYYLLIFCADRLKPALTSVTATLEPVVGTAAAVPLLDQHLAAGQLGGSAIVIISIIVLNLLALERNDL